jgi:putative ABC transport system permease protein
MLIAILAIITAGIGCMVGMLATFNNLDSAKIAYYSTCRMADFWIDLKKAPTTAIDEIASIEGISTVYPRIVKEVIVDLEGVSKPLSGKVISLPSTRKPVLNNIVLRSGGYFTGQRRNEVIVSEKFAQARHLAPGKFIHLIMNGQRKKMFIIGIAISSEFIYLTPPGAMAPSPETYGAFWIKHDYAEDVFGFHGACNNVVGLLTPEARIEPELVLKKVAAYLEQYGVFSKTILKNQFSNLSLTTEMQGLQMMATMLPILFLSVAALVLNVVMLRLVEQQRTVIGTLKALGVKNKDIFAQFILYGLIVGVTGGFTGAALGYWIAAEMTEWYQAFFTFPHLINIPYYAAIISGFIVSILFSACGTIRGVKKVILLEPAEAMRPPPPPIGGKVWLENWTFFWQRLDFRWQIVLRGILRNRGRTLIGIISAAMGSAIVLMSLGMGNSMNYMVYFQFDKVLLSDYEISLHDDVDGGALYEAKRLPGVYHVEPKLTVACTFRRNNHYKKGVITGIIPDARLTVPRNECGSAVKIPSTGILMTTRLAEKLDAKIGDTVQVTPIKGLRKPFDVTIVNTVNSTFGLAVYANYHFLNKLINEDNAISGLQLKAAQGPRIQDQFYKDVKRYPKLSSLGDIRQQKHQIQHDFVNKMNSMIYVMVAFAAIIFFGSILNAGLISISERQREIATFRVLGYRSREIGNIFLREALIINMIGAALGLPVGYWLLYIMAIHYRNDSYSMPCIVNNSTWFIAMGLAFMFIVTAFLIIQHAINKLDWSEALKMKE